MDGTLINTNYANYLSYIWAIKKVLGNNLNIPYNPMVRFTRDSLKSEFSQITEKQFNLIIEFKEKYYLRFLNKTTLNPLGVTLINEYHRTHKTVLVTNCREKRAKSTLEYHGLINKFDFLFFHGSLGENCRINKYEYAILSLGINPDLVIAFENEENDIANAIKAGISQNKIITLKIKE